MANIKALTSDGLDYKIKEEADKLKEARAAVARATNKCTKVYNRLKKLQEESDRRKLEAKPDDIGFLLEVYDAQAGTEHSMLHYHARQQMGAKYGLHAFGHLPSTGQAMFGIHFDRDTKPEQVEKWMEGMNVFLPHMKLATEYEANAKVVGKVFQIYLPSTSDYNGSHYLVIDEEKGVFALVHLYYGTNVKWYESLKEAMYSLLKTANETGEYDGGCHCD